MYICGIFIKTEKPKSKQDLKKIELSVKKVWSKVKN